MTNKIRIFLASWLLPAAVFAQAQTLSLQQAMDYGVENQANIKSADLEIEKAEITVQNRISSGLPQVNASVEYQNFFKLPTSLLPAEFFGGQPGDYIPVQFGTEQNVTASLTATQLLFNGAWLVGVNAAKEYRGLVQAQKVIAEKDVKKNVETAYYSVLIAKEFEKLLQKNIDNLSDVLHEVTEMNKQGFVEQIDVDRLTMSKITLDGQLLNAQRQTALATDYLKFSMGMDMQTAIILTDSLQGMQQEFMINDNDQNYLTRPEFSALNTLIRLNQSNVQLNKAMYLPSLALFASYSENAQRNSFNFFDGDQPWFETGLIGVQMNVPIFSGMERRTNVQTASIGLRKAELDQSTAVQGILMEIAKAKTDYLNAQTDLAAQTKNIALAQKIYETALIKYREGVGSSLELNNAESTLYGAQGSYIGALFNLLTAKTNLVKSLGYY